MEGFVIRNNFFIMKNYYHFAGAKMLTEYQSFHALTFAIVMYSFHTIYFKLMTCAFYVPYSFKSKRFTSDSILFFIVFDRATTSCSHC